jgi:flagellar M-ring protein FliF
MVRGGNNIAGRTADSIRHLVASSVPGLTIDEVTVLDATGKLLAAGDDFSNSNLNRSLSIVQLVQGEVETNIEKALSPFLGIENFRASVNAKSTPTVSRFRKPFTIPNPVLNGPSA